MFAAGKTAGASSGSTVDAQFNYVTMLLHGDGTNGAQNNTFLDSSGVTSSTGVGVITADPSSAVNGWYTRTGSATSDPNASPREYIVRANSVTIYSSTTSFPTSISYGGVTYTAGTYVGSVYGWAGDYSNAFNVNATSSVFTVGVTRTGSTTQGSFSPFGSNWSNYFNGSSYLNVASATASGSGSFCLESWVYCTDVSRQQMVIANATSGGMFLGMNVNSANKLGIGRTFVAIDNEVSFTWVNNTWYHIAVNRSGSSLQFFVNGTQVGATGSNSINYSTSGRQIGSESSGSSLFYGYISNLRCVNASVYTSNFTPSTTPLTAITSTTLLTCQSNRFIDNSSNAFAITSTSASVQRFNPFGTATQYSTTTIGGSGYFDGASQLSFSTNAGYAFGTGDFTAECWYYATSNPGYRSLIETRASNGTNNGWALAADSGGTMYVYANGFILTGISVVLNTWNHVAFTRSGSTQYLFLNGVLVSSTTTARTYSDTNLGVGGISYGTGEYWTGYLSNVRLIKGTCLYTTAFTPPTAPLTAVTNTSLLLLTTNAGIFDNAMINDLTTVGNAQISTSVVKYGTGSMYFDGNGDYLPFVNRLTTDFGTGDFTVECWVYKTTSSGADQVIIDARAANNASPWLLVVNNSNQIYFYTGTAYTTSTSISLNTWSHIAVSRSSGTLKIFIDGVSGFSGSVTTNLDKNAGGKIGSDFSGSAVLNGYIDEFRITKGYARYTANFTPPTAAFPNTGPN